MTTESLAVTLDKLFRSCLFTDDEIAAANGKPEHIPAQGIVPSHGVGFHPGRLSAAREKIAAIMRQMAPNFFHDTGGGWTFLNLCMDKDGHQWGEHINCEQLCQLAVASGMAEYCLPREMWSSLPGGVPYIVFNISQHEENTLCDT